MVLWAAHLRPYSSPCLASNLNGKCDERTQNKQKFADSLRGALHLDVHTFDDVPGKAWVAFCDALAKRLHNEWHVDVDALLKGQLATLLSEIAIAFHDSPGVDTKAGGLVFWAKNGCCLASKDDVALSPEAQAAAMSSVNNIADSVGKEWTSRANPMATTHGHATNAAVAPDSGRGV